ncbi:MAG TPA: RluA family pseudouridine synthase [Candidatus Hydrogenedentes bacterium]|nr:RluA family pseudouridine synthase [Candidatus Hydrogenedentota bacterium]
MFECIAGEEDAGLRLDVFLADAIEDASRSFVQKVIKDGRVRVNGQPATRPSRIVMADDQVEADLPPPPSIDLKPENIPLDVLFEDAEVLVVNKPSGLVVHPAPGHPGGTLINAVLHHCRDFQRAGEDPQRPGIVHRLDRDTSGVMVVAKTLRAFLSLAQQAHDHAFDRRYRALVRGVFKEPNGRINATVGRSLADRKKMAVTGLHGKEAITHYESLERFGVASVMGLVLETGRTHQIRVHLRYAGHPVLGDPVYGVTDFSGWQIPPDVREALENLNGQALHAEHLGFEHPATGERLRFTTPLPEDFKAAVEALRDFAGEKA